MDSCTDGTESPSGHGIGRLPDPKQNTGSCNHDQTVMVKMSSSYSYFRMSKDRISSKYAMESTQVLHYCDVVRSFLCDFVDISDLRLN